MSGIKDFGGFGTDENEDVSGFASDTTGGAGQDPDAPVEVKDDGSDNAGWEAESDVKDLQGAGKEPAKDEPAKEEPGDADKAKAKEPEKKEEKKPEEPDTEGDDKGDDLPEGVKRRVNRAQRQRDRERERADTAERERDELRKQLDAKGETVEVAPKAEDYDDFETYLEAKKAFESKAKEPEKKEEKKPDNKPDTELVGAVSEIKATLADAGHGDLFDKVVSSKDIDVTRDMAIAIAEMENPETILQAFIDNPAMSKEIADLKTPAARMRRLVALDQPYKAPEKKEEAKKPDPAKKQTSAPDPIETTNGNAGGETDYETMEFTTFEERRNAETAKAKDFW